MGYTLLVAMALVGLGVIIKRLLSKEQSMTELIKALEICSTWAPQWESIGKRRSMVKEKLGIEFSVEQDLDKDSPYPCLEISFHVPKKLVFLASHDPKMAQQLGIVIGAVIPHDQSLLGRFLDYPEGYDYYILNKIREIRNRLDPHTGGGIYPSTQQKFIEGIKFSNEFFAQAWDKYTNDAK